MNENNKPTAYTSTFDLTTATFVTSATTMTDVLRVLTTSPDSVPQQLQPIGRLKREGVKFGGALFQLLKTTIELIGVNKPMSDDALRLCCEDIVSDFPHLTFADFQIICRNARKGAYGKTYERINQPAIYRWLETYNEERLTVAEQMNRQFDTDTYGKGKADDEFIKKLYNSQFHKADEPKDADLQAERQRQLEELKQNNEL